MFVQEAAIGLLGVATVDLQNGDAESIAYTVPSGKKAIITTIIICKPTASLAGGTDFDVGDGANADTWKQTINLSSLTTLTDGIVINDDGIKKTIYDAGDEFGIKPSTGATADAQATMMVFGVEFNA
jgi:hypothetical protein